MSQDDTLLLESDLIYDHSLLANVLKDKRETLAVVDNFQPWMNGTVVLCDRHGCITRFIDKSTAASQPRNDYYKTVNIYKLSKSFMNAHYLPALEVYIAKKEFNNYYETVFNDLVYKTEINISAFFMHGRRWYEIDDMHDFNIANAMFLANNE